jgi:hypothetical protein
LSLDLAFDDAQQAVHDAVARFCADAGPLASEPFPHAHWRALAELGVLALATPEGDGGAVEAVAALEALGAAGFPGPLPATFLVTQLTEGEERARIARGAALVSVGSGTLWPWAPVAQVFVAVDATGAWLAEPPAKNAIAPLATLGGEPWGRVAARRVRALAPLPPARALHDLALAAYIAACASALLAAAAAHARSRVQFGRPIGDFQGVAHPLADATMRAEAARTLARAAACAFDLDRDGTGTRRLAGAARLCARGAGLEAAHVAHQTFGALGITLEGPAFRLSRRLRQLASQPPDDAHAREDVLAELGL